MNHPAFIHAPLHRCLFSLRRIGRMFAIALLSLTLDMMSANAVDPPTFRAGAAVAKITPPLGLPVVGNWDSPPATNIHDDLHVRCLALDDGKTRIAFAICDNVGIPREVFDQARKLIDADGQIDADNILMASTHTHSAVSARDSRTVNGETILDSYQSLVARRIAEGIGSAITNLQPAKIGWGGVEEASEVHNRRWYVSDPKMLTNPFGGVDKVRMNPPSGSDALVRPAGPIDPEVSFISVQDVDGKPISLLANYSLHYVGGVPAGDVSADYFGAFSERIGDQLGADESFVGIMTNGTSGDINNIAFQQRRAKHHHYQRIEEVSELIANRVATACRSIHHHDWVPLAMARDELVLQMRKPDSEMLRYFSSLQQAGVDPATIHRHAKTYAGRVKRLAEGPEETSILLQAIRIGDLAVTSIPFEVFAETGLDLKKRNPFDDSFTIELAGGSYGYLPTPAQHELGGYETWMGTNRVQLNASEKITGVLLSLLTQLEQ